MFREEGLDAVVLDHNIDNAFISMLEQGNEGVKFKRIDADITDNFKEETSEDELKDVSEKLSETFKKILENNELVVKVEKLKNENISSMITISEEGRRMKDMMKMYSLYGMDMPMKDQFTLILNANNNLVKFILDNPEGENTPLIAKQLYDLALIQNKPLEPEEMSAFIERSNEILNLIAK